MSEQHKEQKQGLLGFYDYTVILTYCGMLFAVCGIFFLLGEHFHHAVICLMLAGICDMFDGMVASTKKRTAAEKCFGIQIDSMSDLISFGVLPGLFAYCINGKTTMSAVVSALFILCALIRLSYFNVLEEARQQATSERRSSYLGMPVTTIALLLPALFLLQQYLFPQMPAAYLVLLIFCGTMFLLPLSIRKPHAPGKVCMILVGLMELAGMFLVH